MSSGKAMLIIDMPDSCSGCPLNYDEIRCQALDENANDLIYFNREGGVGWSELGIDTTKQRLPHCPLINAATFSGETPIEKSDND